MVKGPLEHQKRSANGAELWVHTILVLYEISKSYLTKIITSSATQDNDIKMWGRRGDLNKSPISIFWVLNSWYWEIIISYTCILLIPRATSEKTIQRYHTQEQYKPIKMKLRQLPSNPQEAGKQKQRRTHTKTRSKNNNRADVGANISKLL